MTTLRAALIAATMLAPATFSTGALARPMTPEDVAKLEQVGTIEVSPDGSRIAYTTASLPDVTSGEDDGGTTQQLKLAWGPDQARDFLPEDMSVSSLSFSPDGRTVSFLYTAKGEKSAVWGIPVDGGAERKLAEVDGASVRAYEWSADGSQLFMLAGAAKDDQRNTQSKAGFNAVVYEEEGKLNRLFVAQVGGEKVDADPREIPLPGYVSAFQLLGDGKRALVESAPTPQVDDSYTAKRVHVIDLSGGKMLQVIATPGKIGDVEASPSGDVIAIVAAVDKNDPAATTLYLARSGTGEMRAVIEGAEEAVVDTTWLSDGSLAAVVHKGARSVLRIYGADLASMEEVDAAGLILTNVEEAGGVLAVEAHAPGHPTELFTYDNGKFIRWTKHNPWLADISFGKQSIMTYTAGDGQEVEGILIEPVGGAAKGGSPTIMMVHGGPESHYSNGWLTAYSMPGQVGAGKGYAVFHPNYRGSTGYGVAFAKAHQDDYAGKEFNDIVDAKRALVAQGITDPKRTGITGGSYGGYASGWGATALSEEYAAAVMFVGISNQISKFGTTDIPWEMHNVHSRHWPWEKWMEMLEVSPIYHVDKAETPLLIMHGDSDTRVSPTQSYELYRNIKVRKPDTPVRLVLYPGEGHGNSKAAARYDYNLRMMEWFDTYLMTGNRKAEMPPPRPRLAAGAKGSGSGD
ncbi:MAG: S9 family peptidase [Sphingomonadaceae bacterium]|nr:S9 family peptidase [Sphingomonadaceae bacterium]